MDSAALRQPADSLPPADPQAALATPVRVCDVLLDAAMAADADVIWFEPRLPAEDRYDISIEHQGRVIAATSLDGGFGAAVVARLALLAGPPTLTAAWPAGRPQPRHPVISRTAHPLLKPGRDE